jgi:hypothetical protein
MSLWWQTFVRFKSMFLEISAGISSVKRENWWAKSSKRLGNPETSLCAGIILGENDEKTTIGDWPDSLDGHNSCGARNWRNIFAV